MAIIRFCAVFLLGVGAALGAYATGALDYVSRQHLFQSWYQQGVAPEHDMVLRVSSAAPNDACPARYVVDNRSGRRVFVVFGTDARFAQAPYGYEGPASYGSNAGYEYGSYGAAGNEEFRPVASYPQGYSVGDPRYAQETPVGAIDPRTGQGASAGPMYPQYAAGYPAGAIDPRYAQGTPAGMRNPQYAAGYPAGVMPDQMAPVEVAPGEAKTLGRAVPLQMADAADPYNPDYGAAMPCGSARVVNLQITDCATGDSACVAAMSSPGGAITQGR